MEQIKNFIKRKWWIILIVIFILSIVSKNTGSSDNSSVSNSSNSYPCPSCGMPIENGVGYMFSGGAVTKVAASQNISYITCRKCAKEKSDAYYRSIQ